MTEDYSYMGYGIITGFILFAVFYGGTVLIQIIKEYVSANKNS